MFLPRRVIDLDEFKTFAALGLKGSDQDKLRGTQDGIFASKSGHHDFRACSSRSIRSYSALSGTFRFLSRFSVANHTNYSRTHPTNAVLARFGHFAPFFFWLLTSRLTSLVVTASFHIFDTNNDGSLSRDELKLKIRAVLKGKRMAHNFSAMYSKILDKETDQVVDKIFDLIDTDKNGTIDVEEFVTGFAENAEVSELLRDIAYSMSDL